MTEQKSKKLSRRDAIKLLGAATGAAALANLPSKWSKPELATGVLPAHAQQSTMNAVCTQYSLTAQFIAPTNGDFGSGGPSGGVVLNVNPDTGPNTTPVVGDLYTWNCTHTGCFFGTFNLNPASGGGNPVLTLLFTTISQTRTVTWNAANLSHTVSVNFDTGAIAVDGCATGCTCP
jgi:hypothetical protein